MISYKHEPFMDFSLEENKNAYLEGLKTVDTYVGDSFPLIIGGERITTEDKITSYNPANKTQVIGHVSKASRELAEKAMQVANEAFQTWKKDNQKFVQMSYLKLQPLFAVVNSSFQPY